MLNTIFCLLLFTVRLAEINLVVVDDTCLILQVKHLSALNTKINDELNATNKWIVANK